MTLVPSAPDPESTDSLVKNPDEWPPAPPNVAREDAEKVLFEAQVASHGAMLQHGRTRVEASHAADLANAQRYYESLMKLADGSIDRAHAGADTVQKAAAAVATIYAAILGVSFSVSSKPLPWRGVLAPSFLCIAIALSTAYRAYIAGGVNEGAGPNRTGVFPRDALNRANSFTELMQKFVLTRASLLRASVVALAIGILYMPAPFVSFPDSHPNGKEIDTRDWPPEPKGGIEKEYGVILYKAQVDEVASLHADARETESPGWVIGLGVAGLLAVYIGGRPWKSSGSGQEKRKQGCSLFKRKSQG